MRAPYLRDAELGRTRVNSTKARVGIMMESPPRKVNSCKIS